MNYRHAFHAGNFADVMKHVALVAVIEHLLRKDKPFRVVDVHAGRGWYDLGSDEARRTGEWRDGIGRLAKRKRSDDPIGRYLALLDGIVASHGDGGYPGSPLIARALLRADDRLHVNELHPVDGVALAALFARARNVVVTRVDAWSALKAALPPRERRGVLLIDPPFEELGELDRMVDGIVAAQKRFATGIVLAWYPIKDLQAIGRFKRNLAATGIDKMHCAEMFVRDRTMQDRLNGCGLVLVNPPYGFVESYRPALAELARVLALDGTAFAQVEPIVPARTGD